MSFMKKIIIVVLIIIGVLGVCGCMKKESKTDRMMNYINAKYDDNFTFKSVYGGHLGSTEKKILVSSEKFPQKEICVICTEENGKEEYSDTYLGIKFEEQTRSQITAILKSIFGENLYVKYNASNLACTKGGTNNTTFEEYISEKTSHISFEAIVKENVDDQAKKDVINEIKKMFVENAMCCIGRIHFTSDEVDFTSDSGYESYISYLEEKKYEEKLYFVMNSVDEFSIIEWVD